MFVYVCVYVYVCAYRSVHPRLLRQVAPRYGGCSAWWRPLAGCGIAICQSRTQLGLRPNTTSMRLILASCTWSYPSTSIRHRQGLCLTTASPSGQFGRHGSEFGQILAAVCSRRFRSTLVAKFPPHLVELGPNLTHIGPTLVDPGQISASRATLVDLRPTSAGAKPNLPMLAEAVPHLGILGPKSTEFSRFWPQSGQTRPGFGQICAGPAGDGPIWENTSACIPRICGILVLARSMSKVG